MKSDTNSSENGKKESDKKNERQSWREKLIQVWKSILSIAKKNCQFIVTCIFSCGLLAFIGSRIIKFFRTRRKYLFLCGANSAGKSTMLKYLLNPEASLADLVDQTPTSKLVKERIIRDDINRKITLKAKLLDPPGHELQCIIDELVLTFRDKILKRKFIIILVIAPTKSNKKNNDIDNDYLRKQLDTISNLWSAVLKSKKTVKPQHVILFISKKDLFENKDTFDQLFELHMNVLKKICYESKISFHCISGSVMDRSGMTELMNILKESK